MLVTHCGQPVTLDVTNHATPSGICFTDRPGIDIPGAQAENAEASTSATPTGTAANMLKRAGDAAIAASKWFNWRGALQDLYRRLRSSSAEDRPLALVYVQHAAQRLYPDKVGELLRRSHELLVPTFVVISDKWSVDQKVCGPWRDGVEPGVRDGVVA